jgi:exopolysaccharide production protein ExoQ
MSNVAQHRAARTFGSGRPARSSLRPAAPSTSLIGQITGLAGGLVDEEPIEFLALLCVYIGVFSSVSTLTAMAGLAVFGLLLWGRGLAGIGRLLVWTPLLAYAVVTVLSTAWSPDPAITARYSTQYLLTGLIGLYVGVYRTPSDGVKLVHLSTFALIIASIISGRQGSSADGAVLVGVLGSKNALAYTAEAVVLSGLVLTLSKEATFWRVLGLVSVPLCAILVLKSHATGSLVTTFIGVFLLLSLRAGSLMTSRVRLLCAVVLVAIAAGAVVMHKDLEALAADLNARLLHKDSTLTGRTILWGFARQFIEQKPWFGWGYKEAWLGTGAETTGLLRWAGLLDGRGFYFHNTWLEASVDTGVVGASVLALTWVFTGALLMWTYVRREPVGAIQYALANFVLVVITSFGETGTQPFSLGVATVATMGVWAVRGCFATQRTASPHLTSSNDPARYR